MDWSEIFIAQGVLRARLEQELTAEDWLKARNTAWELVCASSDLHAWIGRKMDKKASPGTRH